MNRLRKNGIWLLINLIAIFPLIGVLALFNIDFSGSGPFITIDLPARMQDAVANGKLLTEARSPFWFPIHSTGEWAIRFLVLSLTMTPIMILFGIKKPARYRRLFGLYAFGYSFIHALFFVADRGLLSLFDKTNYILGLISLLILIPLAVTSNRFSIRKLKKKWKKLQRFAYPAGVLAVLHVVLLERGSWELYAVLLTIGFLLRIPIVRNAILSLRVSKQGKGLNRINGVSQPVP